MSSKRTVVLMAILLALLAYVGWRSTEAPAYLPPGAVEEGPLPGRTTINKMDVRRKPDGGWELVVDYFFTGAPLGTSLQIEQLNARDGAVGALEPSQAGNRNMVRGANTLTIDLQRPGEDSVRTTKEIVANIWLRGTVVQTQRLARTIEWPSFEAMQVDSEMGSKTPDEILAHAVQLIDSEQEAGLRRAKLLLERLVAVNPQNDAAFVEMARIAMKQQWGVEGLSQAEALIRSALQLRPDSVNAKILLAYVYSNQKRYKEAEPLFIEASKVDTPNLWLGTNWGEMLQQQGKTSAAIAKYREVLAHPPAQDTYDRARRHAAGRLMALLNAGKDLDAIEVLHKQLTGDYGANNCYGVDYARFLVQQRGDTTAGMAMAQRASTSRCDEEAARQVLGLAHYLAWSRSKEPGRAEALRQARIVRPVGPALIYELAMSERTLPAIQQLIAEGERVDQLDNSRVTALAYALRANDLTAARRLLRMGAKPDALVGDEQMPLALMPVLTGNLESIRLMQSSGVDYSKLRYKGMTALDHARSIHDGKLLQALDPKAGSL
jgi:tetratricopeptide (TPR) repeat protein